MSTYSYSSPLADSDSNLTSHYSGSLAAVSGIIGFVLAASHVYLNFKLKTWFFHTMWIGVVLETVGFIALAAVANKQDTNEDISAILVLPLVLLFISPSLITIACYMVFDRVVWFITPSSQRTAENLWMPARQITVTAVLIEVLGLLMTFVGFLVLAIGIKNGTGSTNVDTGYGLLMFGLAIQLVGRLYMFLSSYQVKEASKAWIVRTNARKWDMHTVLNGVIVSGSALTFRALYRVVIFGGKCQQSQWMAYAFDALPVAIVVCIFAICHPGHALPESFTRFRLDKDSLASRERTAHEIDADGLSIESAEVNGESKATTHVAAQELA